MFTHKMKSLGSISCKNLKFEGIFMLFVICEPLCHHGDIIRHCVEKVLCTVLSVPFYNIYT